MHGRAAEERHMWTGPTRGNSIVVGDVSSSSSSSSSVSPANSFSKDGRKISVGDCALFKPPQDSPPFIGVIRWLINGKENELSLCVNWLYRPSEVKLGKGILLEAAPNEVFYSFHKDEIPAASLLHPCKVAFLAKGVELPSGICSFVCRRVYDITNKCLWWLTDQDYINERQVEVDKLLYKTRVEMHATAQAGGLSPKIMNGPTSASQLKSSLDNIQNNTASFPSQVKGKKRERVDQGSEPVKRERSSKMDDANSDHSRPESFWKSEISKFTENGSLVDPEGVEKLVQLLLSERNDKKIDLVGRSTLAGVIAATDKFDCLNRFVQLRGLPVFDDWLQEVHKGKIGEGSSVKDNDKPIEEFLVVLLRALDKLPVNLHALQMCYIGKSVNHLRAHKNLEIQKKARSLVDTWKKRVEAEMDAKSGSQAARQRLPEVSHSGTASEIAMKSSAAQILASKSAPVKGEPKSVSAPPCSLKSSPPLAASVGNNLKEGQALNTPVVTGVCETPLITAGDDKSSSSSQSHNNSQSCSSDHAKPGGYSGKEDARSSTAASMIMNKSSRHRKSVNGFPGPTSSSGPTRILSVQRNPNADKLPQSSVTCEKVVDKPAAEVNNHKLIVKLSNRGRSPGISASGGPLEDPSVLTSKGSPVQQDQLDQNSKDKNDAYRVTPLSDVKAESWQSNDFKQVLTGSDEGDLSPATVPDEDNSTTCYDARKLVEISKAASPSSGKECKSVKLQDDFYTSMNALIESCLNYSEPNMSSISGADDLGMNLLASVATGEMSKLEPSSPQKKATVGENNCTNIDSKLKSSPGDNFALEQGQPVDDMQSITPTKKTEDKSVFSPQAKLISEPNGHLNTSHVDAEQVSKPCMESNVQNDDKLIKLEKTSNGKGLETWEEKSNEGVQSIPKKVSSSFDHEDKVAVVSGTETENMKSRSTELNVLHSEGAKGSSGEMSHCFDSEKFNVVKTDEAGCGSQALKKQKTQESNIGSAVSGHKGNFGERIGRNKGTEQQARSGGSKLTGTEAVETEEFTSAVMETAPSSAGDAKKEGKIEFDLNEGLNGDDGRFGELSNLRVPDSFSSVQLVSPLALPSASVTVAAAAKRPFVPLEDLLKNKAELGWKGSAATSAFRPAEPRKSLDLPLTISNTLPDASAGKATLDIDLNVADEEDTAFRMAIQVANSRNSGGLELDLNRVDEPTDIVTGNGHMLDHHPVKLSIVSGVHNRELRVRRDFDLNDGPLVEEPSSVHLSSFGQHTRNSSQPSPVGNFSSWFTQANPYPAVTMHSSLPDRGEQQQPFPRMLPVTTPFTPDIYRETSSPAVAFPSAPFQYSPVFFGNFPTAFSGGSTAYVDSPSSGRICLRTMHSQVLGPAGAVHSHHNRPFAIGNNSGNAESSRKWGRQGGLDLNTGPLGQDIEGGRADTSSLASRQLSAEEQLMMYQVAGGGGAILKRKEPDGGGWEGYKQAPWK